eukprot:1782834-Rhodomonas_salina.2
MVARREAFVVGGWVGVRGMFAGRGGAELKRAPCPRASSPAASHWVVAGREHSKRSRRHCPHALTQRWGVRGPGRQRSW